MPAVPIYARVSVTAGCPHAQPITSSAQRERPLAASNAESSAASDDPTNTVPSRTVAGDSIHENQMYRVQAGRPVRASSASRSSLSGTGDQPPTPERLTRCCSPPRFSAMTVIAHNPNLKLTELAKILGVARSGAVLLVDTLEDMGMVERQPAPKDKRAFRLVLTAKGATTLDDITRAVTKHDARVTAHLSTGERQTLLALLNKLASGPDTSA